MKSFWPGCVLAAWILAIGSEVLACPFCDSEVGREVQAGIFNEEFWRNVLLVLLPFPLFLIIVALIYAGVPWPQKKVSGKTLSGPQSVSRPSWETNL